MNENTNDEYIQKETLLPLGRSKDKGKKNYEV
jgi:hypothetical protein